MSLFKGTKGKLSYSGQVGTLKNCMVAQVWDKNGKNLATIEPTKDSKIASANALLFSKSPELLKALIESTEVLKAFNFRHGQIKINEKLIEDATSLSILSK